MRTYQNSAKRAKRKKHSNKNRHNGADLHNMLRSQGKDKKQTEDSVDDLVENHEEL
jgi:hypothetical protein